MSNAIIQQGRFTSDGTAKVLSIRSDVDRIEVFNETAAAQAAADLGYKFEWQRGMTQGRGWLHTKLGTVANDPVTVGQIAANSGFFLINSSDQVPGNNVAETGITNVIQPVVTTANTGALVTGSIVRLNSDTGVPNLMGFDFEVDNVNAGANFRMRWALANGPGAVGNGDGNYRHIEFDPIFYPRRRFVVNITQAANAVVRFSVTHGYTVGQTLRFTVPPEFGMTQMDGVDAIITAVDTANNTVTLNVDSSAFTAFAFPGVAATPFNWAQAVPYGIDSGTALSNSVDLLGDATDNEALLGVRLMPGISSPAGQNNDVISWWAYKAFSVTNE